MRMDAGINGDAQRIEQMVWMLFLKVYDAKEDDWELNEDNYESIIPEALRWRNWAKADSNGHAMTGDKLLNFVNNVLFCSVRKNPGAIAFTRRPLPNFKASSPAIYLVKLAIAAFAAP